ncbi:MAG: hypothetical protein KF842_06875 [Caulobacter sp.]|nr:hypothetical protein [Caulobacter sp.]
MTSLHSETLPGVNNEGHVRAVLAAREGGFAGGGMAAVALPPVKSAPGRRQISAIPTPQLTPGVPAGQPPKFALVDPKKLLVDESYQRGLSNRSVKLIRRIVGGWDWRKYKPPVVAPTVLGLEVIDGQHTAIAAACHPGIGDILVMVVEAATREARAAAFVGHNRERLNLTPMQVHHAAAISGDGAAAAIEEACRVAGVVILKTNPSDGFRPGQTVAIAAIGALVKRRGPDKAAAVLKVLVEAGCAPVSADWIKAADELINGAEYAGEVGVEALAAMIGKDRELLERDAALTATAHRTQIWRALVVVTYRRLPKSRRKAAQK